MRSMDDKNCTIRSEDRCVVPTRCEERLEAEKMLGSVVVGDRYLSIIHVRPCYVHSSVYMQDRCKPTSSSRSYASFVFVYIYCLTLGMTAVYDVYAAVFAAVGAYISPLLRCTKSRTKLEKGKKGLAWSICRVVLPGVNLVMQQT